MSAAPESTREFDPEFFQFLRELEANNDREWFAANKARYEADVLEPALAFIEDFGYRLAEMQLKILWEEMLKRDLKIELAGPPVRLYSNFIRGIRALPVIIRA